MSDLLATNEKLDSQINLQRGVIAQLREERDSLMAVLYDARTCAVDGDTEAAIAILVGDVCAEAVDRVAERGG